MPFDQRSPTARGGLLQIWRTAAEGCQPIIDAVASFLNLTASTGRGRPRPFPAPAGGFSCAHQACNRSSHDATCAPAAPFSSPRQACMNEPVSEPEPATGRPFPIWQQQQTHCHRRRYHSRPSSLRGPRQMAEGQHHTAEPCGTAATGTLPPPLPLHSQPAPSEAAHDLRL